MKRRNILTSLCAAALLACSTLPAMAAMDVAGVKFDDTIKVAGSELKLNGAGVRTKVFFKVYAAGLYLTEKKTKAADVMAVAGPRRLAITMLREVSSDAFGAAFMEGLNNNTDKSERSRLLPQTMKFGEIFAQIQTLKKGDHMTFDWTPGEGTQCYLNGKKIGELLPDVAFYNAVLRIWLGEHPVEQELKSAMLGEK